MMNQNARLSGLLLLAMTSSANFAQANTTNEDLENQIAAVATNVVDIKTTTDTTELSVSNLTTDTADIRNLISSIQSNLNALDASLAQQGSDNSTSFSGLDVRLQDLLLFVQQNDCVTSKTVDLPTWLKGGSNARKTVYYISNKSDQDVTIKMQFIKSDGTVYDETTESGDNIRLAGITVDPVNTSGAVIAPGITVTVNNTAVGTPMLGSATLTWESSICLVNPLKVSTRMEWVNRSDSWIEVNDGKRF